MYRGSFRITKQKETNFFQLRKFLLLDYSLSMSSDTSNNSARSGLTAFTEDEQQAAKNAQVHFKSNQHEMAISILKKLQKSHSNDPRLMHNRALTEFFKSGKTKISDFKKSLAKV